ncbi:MAG: PspC domain-containing protein [Chloroflexota bacterium]
MNETVKRLYRSRKERMLGGVCAGLGEYLRVDPTLLRLLFVLFTLMGGQGILAYLILWVIVPDEPIVLRQEG